MEKRHPRIVNFDYNMAREASRNLRASSGTFITEMRLYDSLQSMITTEEFFPKLFRAYLEENPLEAVFDQEDEGGEGPI